MAFRYRRLNRSLPGRPWSLRDFSSRQYKIKVFVQLWSRSIPACPGTCWEICLLVPQGCPANIWSNHILKQPCERTQSSFSHGLRAVPHTSRWHTCQCPQRQACRTLSHGPETTLTSGLAPLSCNPGVPSLAPRTGAFLGIWRKSLLPTHLVTGSCLQT